MTMFGPHVPHVHQVMPNIVRSSMSVASRTSMAEKTAPRLRRGPDQTTLSAILRPGSGHDRKSGFWSPKCPKPPDPGIFCRVEELHAVVLWLFS
ncbi:Hypp5517 [Branchiostoma lanceolatum]|uniref:Hypp5517 protein n=1 Tax=Branchiostoma lanceolatum TaxID=7740 RepID=A0A8J9VXE3_BRALA|nr:Hypp5517 [Branchiostoma lanceolatum]